MKRSPFVTIMVIPPTEDGPKSLKVSSKLLQVLSVLLLIGLTFSFLGIYDYSMLKYRNENLKITLAQNVNTYHEYTENYLALYQDVKEVKKQVEVIQKLEEKVKLKNGFDPTKSFFSTKNQEAIKKNTVVASTLTTNGNASKEHIGDNEVVGESEKSLNELIQLLEDRDISDQTVPSIWPTIGKITTRFGYIKDPFNNDISFHTGIDITNVNGTPIYATADGIVVYSSYHGVFGNYIIINHGNGYETSYAHQSNNLVSKGDFILKGQLIGYMGSTGRSTSPRIHYEVKKDGKEVNPQNYLN